MKTEKNQCSKKDLNRGFEDGEHKGEGVEDDPKNSMWRDLDDGGFLGRPKGNER